MRLAARNLSWAANGVAILSSISFTLEPGTVTACLGPNGAGKTTLLNILSGWTKPTAGEIGADERNYSSLTPEEAYRLGILRRFDPPKLIRQLSVIDNVCLAAAAPRHEGLLDAFLSRMEIARAEKAVRLAALPLLQRLGLDDKLRRRVASLSVGEQKLLDFALGILSAPRCLLLDEPLKDRVHVDRKAKVLDTLRELTRDGASALIVEHDLDFVREAADRVLLLDGNGTLAWDGSTQDSKTWRLVHQIYHRADNEEAVDLTPARPASPRPPQSTTDEPVPRLSATNLSAGYGGAPVLDGASIQLAAGEIAVLRGENGAGKSTLLFALAGLVDAKGSVKLDGQELLNRPAHQRARDGLLLVAQEHKIFPAMSVAENILAGSADESGSAQNLLALALKWFPELRGRMNLAASRLSSGQKQMVALARTFLRRPRCMLLDEPTSGLDPGIRARVRTMIRDAAKDGVAVLLVEHVREAVEDRADATYFLRGGRLEPAATAPNAVAQ